MFYQRLREAYPALQKLSAKGVSVLPLLALHRVLSDAALRNLVTRIEHKITLFDRLREAMRIARPDCGQGLNDGCNPSPALRKDRSGWRLPGDAVNTSLQA